MMQKKSLWTVLVVVLLMVLAMNGAAADEEAFKSRNYRYRILEDGTAEITKYSGGDEVLKIPETLDGKTVTGIGDYAFSERRSLTSIELPDGVMSMGDYAFYQCDALESIVLPDSMVSMGTNPFLDCESLKNIRVSPEQPVFAAIDGVLFNKAEKSLICYPAGKQEEAYEVPQGIQQIGDSAFWHCASLTSIKLPDSVTSIGDGAFSSCSALTSIELPDGLTSIGDSTFSRCSTLTSIELPDSVTNIGDRVFWYCSALTSIELPESVTSMGIDVFKRCDNLTMTVQRDSYAVQYAKDNGLNYTYPDANDWLNN